MGNDVTTAAELAALRASFEAFLDNYKATSEAASHERREMLQTISKLAENQDRLAHDMAEVKPVTDMVTGIRARFMGGLMVLGVIGAVVWAGVQFFKEQIIRFLSG
ncbi:MAG: DUF1515 domain-containing protein [Synechococcaceae cyanobacterium SM1_2_3]|nr:DUF1515 domain-containing protein [Synechococcaceae cyanobacterium SM1_2_3]